MRGGCGEGGLALPRSTIWKWNFTLLIIRRRKVVPALKTWNNRLENGGCSSYKGYVSRDFQPFVLIRLILKNVV